MFPVSEDEQDRIDFSTKNNNKAITLKSYGLPLIFWAYLVIILTVITAMFIAIKGPIEKLIMTGDPINIALSYCALIVLFGLPTTLLALYFYEKLIFKCDDQIIITHRIFWLPIWRKVILLKSSDSIEINHFSDGPNVAKIRQDHAMKGFENKGYFELFAIEPDNKKVFLDRHSRKADVAKMRDLLKKY